MSLKALHVCFIVLSIALAFGFGLWAVRDYSVSRSFASLSMGIGSLIGGGVLTGYLFWFLHKMKKVGSS